MWTVRYSFLTYDSTGDYDLFVTPVLYFEELADAYRNRNLLSLLIGQIVLIEYSEANNA